MAGRTGPSCAEGYTELYPAAAVRTARFVVWYVTAMGYRGQQPRYLLSVGRHFHLTTQGSPPCPCALLSPCASAISSFPWTSVEWKRTPHILSAHFMRYYKPASTIELWLCMKAYYCSTHLERPAPSVRSRFVNVQYLHTIGLSYMDSQLGTHTHIGHTGRPKERAHIVRRQRERKQKDTDRKLGSYQWPTG